MKQKNTPHRHRETERQTHTHMNTHKIKTNKQRKSRNEYLTDMCIQPEFYSNSFTLDVYFEVFDFFRGHCYYFVMNKSIGIAKWKLQFVFINVYGMNHICIDDDISTEHKSITNRTLHAVSHSNALECVV